MDRRTFLSLAAVSPLLAKEQFVLKDNIFIPKDALYTPKKIETIQNDIFIKDDERAIFASARARIRRVKRFVGYGNFNIIAFDSVLYYARNYSSIGKFPKKELELLDKLFYEDPTKYGFYGKKISSSITTRISKKHIKKVPRTGHYLFKGKALEDYKRLKQDIGKNLILTSGVRSVVKQMSLYMDKIYSLNGNITKASYSLAPPAYTYHSIKDFDVGKKGFGYDNFTERFARTSEFRELKKLSYISMRYEKNNKDGVRYEPWHVKVI
ncbi:MAG TPA: twin-arginine translocation pathway signal protein [Arcobacter sp.]|nr:twin-arginine translocation pathway signal protein [Arcobacter sp.]